MRPVKEDSVGLFWTDKPNQRHIAAPSQPVVMKPYQARAPLQYEIATREELIAGAGGTMVFDVECFENFFLVAFKNISTKKITIFTAPFNEEKLRWVMQNYTCIGFNSYKYDLPLVWMAYANQNMEVLKMASNDIINTNAWPGEIINAYSITMRPCDHIDLIEVCPLRGSLKLYAGRLHAKRLLDLPWAGSQSLEDWQIPITQDYCICDLDDTELLFNNLKEQMQLRYDLTKEYKEDLRSKSDAQIAEAIITSELFRLTRKRPKRPQISPGSMHKFVPPDNLYFQSDYMKGVLKTVTDASFYIADTGYLIRPDEIKNLEIKLGSSVYRMGIGGLHSSEKTMAVVADENRLLVDRDVAGYYPAIVLNCKLAPKNLGLSFLVVYQNLVSRRLEAKRLKNLAVSENLKVAVNGTFGKTGNPYSILYAPDVIVQILLGGQLYLLMLIEMLEMGGVPIISGNTDGCLMHCSKDKYQAMLDIVKEWERITGFETEEAQYKAVYARDVNAYLAVKTDGTVKGKNVYYDPWRIGASAKDQYWRFQKNPTCQICVEAVELLITKGISIEETIRQCTDVTRFVAIKNVTGGAHFNGEYLGKVVRWYYANGASGTINYIKSNRIVADTEGAVPLMDLSDELPSDINYDYYVQRCKDMLTDMGAMT